MARLGRSVKMIDESPPPPQALTPLIVQAPSDIPIMNIVFFVPAGVGAVLGLIKVKTSLPPSPPSQSSEQSESYKK